MSVRLSPYLEYKDSGVEWLGTIPAHWTVSRFKYVLREIESRSVLGDEELLSVSQYTGVTMRRSSSSRGSRAESLVGYKVVHHDDFVVNIMLAWNGSMGVSAYDGVVSPAYGVYRFKPTFNPWYYHHLLRQPLYKGVIKTNSTGVVESRLRLYSDDLFRIQALVPPPDEQAAIVRFLDAVDRRVSRLLRDKRRLIALLNEQKQAIVHHAVTKGLAPGARMKPSGIEWLGEIPAHWHLGRLDRFLILQRGHDITKEQQSEGIVPVVSSGGISSYHNESTSKGPGVIIGRKGSLGTVHYIESEYWAHDTTLYVKDFKGNNPRFAFYLLKYLDLKRFDTGSANPTLNRNVVHPETIVVVPQSEQSDIVSRLDKVVDGITQQIQKINLENELLREYRTRLVADVVTGKLDVRGALLSDAPPSLGNTSEEELDDVDDASGEDDEIDEVTDDADE